MRQMVKKIKIKLILINDNFIELGMFKITCTREKIPTNFKQFKHTERELLPLKRLFKKISQI